MAEYSFPDYSGIFGQESNYDWASTEGIGDSWQGQYNPESPAIYTPQTQAPAATSWLDVLKGVGIVADAAGNAIRAYRGMPRVSGGPYDQWVAAEEEKTQAKKDEDLLSKLLERFSKDSTEEKRVDPMSLLERNVLDPTQKIRKTGVTDYDETGGLPSLKGFRLAGELFRPGSSNLF